MALKTVVETYVKETKQLIYVYIGDKKIETTAEHPFYFKGKGWVKALNLKIGNELASKNGERKIVNKIEVKEFDAPITVYNFQVTDFHTYYVTSDAILVHNANCGDADVGKLKRLSKREIKAIGGEEVTRNIKRTHGGSLSNLYIDRKTNEVFAIGNGSKMGSYIGLFENLKDSYK
ncbi:polymorphic toxin-type HINT domain-containing protein [Clostridium sediminicola]|uniref:polymorphic toxin-type HINT domain-containing protein n=1 Tax=Clostridium sediminicola TaxID=3114879 RepID=UPI003D183FED